MTDDDINVVCSKTINNYVMFYDGLGTYQIYYKNELIQEFDRDLTPKLIHSQYKKNWYCIYSEFKELIEDDDLKQLLGHIESNIEQSKTNQQQIMDTFRNLIISLKDGYMDFSVTFDNYKEAELPIKEAFRELLASIDDMENIFMQNLLDTMSVDEIIEQRRKPDLTEEQMEIASKIASDIKKYGLLAYLKDILDNLHIGEHKNIYRKILMLFNVMRGKGSYISETTAKAEAGKSFEDEIVFNLIAPSQYIFEVNDITLASFRRYGTVNEFYFDRMIVLLGDMGDEDDFNEAKPIFKPFKVLITENRYTSVLSDNSKGKGWENADLNLKVDSVGVVYQTTINSFTKGNAQLESRTIYSTPPLTDDVEIMKQGSYLNYSKSKQSIERRKAERKLKEFGLFLMMRMLNQEEIINPYTDVFVEYALQSNTPKREFNQQMQLFDAYCHLTIDKCNIQYKGNTWASIEQLKEYMDYVNLENALIPYEYNFLQMIIADGKSHQLHCLYDVSDLKDDNGEYKKEYINKDTGLIDVPTIQECELEAIKSMNAKLKQREDLRLKKEGYNETEREDILSTFEPIKSVDDLSVSQMKELPQRMLSLYGVRGSSVEKQKNIFFRTSDLQNLYYRYKPYKDIDNVPQLLQMLHKKGYIGKYEHKQGKENLYYLNPLCMELTKKFETDKSFDDYAVEYINNTGGYDYYD